MAEELCKTVDPAPDMRVLDVACGSGSGALIASRRYCEAVGIDYVPALIRRAVLRADAEGYDAEFMVADAQDLPFPENAFDAVISIFGVQFAPDQQKAANEMLRVCRPGGIIGLASPVPDGWTGDFFKAHSRKVPPHPGVQPAFKWGTAEALEEMLGHGVKSIRCEDRVNFGYYRSVPHAVEVFSTYFGPTLTVLNTLLPEERPEFLEELKTIFERYNRATDTTAKIETKYMLSIAECR